MRSLVCAVALALTGISAALDRPSLDLIAGRLLDRPEILAELSVTPRQRSTVEGRVLGSVFRAVLESARKVAKGDAESLNFQLTVDLKLPPSELTPVQIKRARQIAMQRLVLDSLLTSELALALDLTPAQIERLNLVAANRDRAYKTKISAKPVQTYLTNWSQLSAEFKKITDGKFDEFSDEEFAKLVSLSERLAVDLARYTADVNEMRRAVDREFNARALRTLTAHQRAELRRLQGRPFTG